MSAYGSTRRRCALTWSAPAATARSALEDGWSTPPTTPASARRPLRVRAVLSLLDRLEATDEGSTR